jgi:hypothetical protein
MPTPQAYKKEPSARPNILLKIKKKQKPYRKPEHRMHVA